MNVRVRFIGRRDWRVPRSVLKEIEIAEARTRDNTGMTLTIAFNYGGRAEVVDAVRGSRRRGARPAAEGGEDRRRTDRRHGSTRATCPTPTC